MKDLMTMGLSAIDLTTKTCYRNKTVLAISILSLLGISFTPPAFAGLFSVTPVRMYMTPKDKAIAVTITNDGDEELVMQADLYSWKQKPGGQDELTLTEDMFLSPPIIKLAAKSRQVVRLARLSTTKPTEQLTYRMIVREIPEAKPIDKMVEVQIALAFSMPVFVTPPNAKAKLNCTGERLAINMVKVTCENTGNAYSHPLGLVLNSTTGDKIASEDTGAYILSGITRSFDLKRTEGNIPAGKAKLVVTLDDGTSENYDINIAE